MVYKWQGYKYSVDADVVGKEFERIEKENGSLTPQLIVDAARSKSSKIHSMFEWNDKVGAECWRNEQARHIMHALVVVDEPEAKEMSVSYRAFVNVEEGMRKGKYVNLHSALETEETRSVLLKNAYMELHMFKMKYERLSELSGVIAAINEIGEVV